MSDAARAGSAISTVGVLQQAQPSPQHQMSGKPERKSCYGLSRRASLVVAPRPSLAAADNTLARFCSYDVRFQS